ncbi:MAG: hypothetical protein AB1646_19640 [Thermodesulfobacteriota bacterium]
MRRVAIWVVCVAAVLGASFAFAGADASRPCYPDRPVPPETLGGISVPFEFPIWPTLLKTEFHILPWVSFGRASVCIPGTCKAIEFPAPSLSLKPVPIWIPWLRPLDVECADDPTCKVPR